MSVLEIVATLLALSAVFGYFNHKFLKLPHTIGLVVIALVASLVVIAADAFLPGVHAGALARETLEAVDFRNVLLNGFLSAMLFAGAVHVDLSELVRGRWAIGLLATVGVLISTVVTGALMWAAAPLFGVALPFIWALVFGALISPTDPIAVLAIMRRVRVPAALHAKISGESLLNDGVGVVVFTLLLAIAGVGGEHMAGEIGASDVAALFAKEAGGGVVLGLLTGLIAYWLMRTLDEHNIEVMITLALVAGTYALALRLEVSGPLAVVVAGVLIGNHGARFAMSDNTREHVFQFWDLVDEILNSLLFLLIGLEVLELATMRESFGLAAAAIPIVLAARAISVAVPIGLLKFKETFDRGTVRILTWGGLRGGISVALALSLPVVVEKSLLLAATYAVVVFSILVQGLTVERLVKRIYPESGDMVPMPMPRT
jgi:CPA1 family monovalent cation:H+ antiporter